jgi:putative ABC transport system permease protein
VHGREFNPSDSQPGTEGVIVSRRFAARHWPSQNPVGRRIRLGQGPWREVRGVSPDIRQTSLRRDHDPVAYLPLREAPPYHFQAIVRVRRGTAGAAQVVRTAFRELDPELAVPDVEPLEATLGELSRETRILGMLFSLFACIGVFLSAVGIYSVTAYATSQRTRDIGIRIALGATQADIVRLVLRSGVAQLVAALAVGLPGAVALSRVFESVLFEVSPLDPMTFLAVPLGLSAVVLVACWIPARRASRLPPTDALRVE